MKIKEKLKNKRKALCTFAAVLNQSQRFLWKLIATYTVAWGVLIILGLLTTSTSDIAYTVTEDLTAADVNTSFVFLEKGIRMITLFVAIMSTIFNDPINENVSFLSAILAVLIFLSQPFELRFFVGVCVYCFAVWTIWNLVHLCLCIKTDKKTLNYDELVSTYGRIAADEMIREGFPCPLSADAGKGGQIEEKA